MATAVSKDEFSIRKLFSKCFPMQTEVDADSAVCAIKLQCSVNDIKGCRRVTLKGLSGSHTKLKQFMSSFRDAMHVLVKEEQTQNPPVKKSSKKQQKANEQSEDEDISGLYTKTSSIYQLNKVMSQEQYCLGRNIQKYFEDFHLQYTSVKESALLLPQPMQSVVGFVNETVKAFEGEHNLGNQKSKEMLKVCRPTVEKYIFGKLHSKLFNFYAEKYQKRDQKFRLMKEQILAHYESPRDFMLHLGIKDKFIPLEKPY